MRNNLLAWITSLTNPCLVEFFDKDENSTGGLTSCLSENPQKVNGLAGITLGAIVEAISTVVTGLVIGFVFCWKLALVSLGAFPPPAL